MSDKKVVLITGASSGIGYATALAFAKAGVNVVGTARRAERLASLNEQITQLPVPHGGFLAVTADVQSGNAMHEATQQAYAHFGRLDYVVANAGLGQRGSIVDSEWDDLQRLLRTNIDGVLHTIRASVPVIKRSGNGGHIILVSSIVYNMTSPYAATYAGSKAFVSSIAKSLRLELEADNIKVTDMLIGRTESEFNRSRLGKSGYGEGGGSFPPHMPVEQVAEAIVNATQRNKKAIALRWIDRLILLGNLLVPNLIGRRALKQYK